MSKKVGHVSKKPSKLRAHFTSAVAGAAVGAGALFMGMPGVAVTVGLAVFGAMAPHRMPQTFKPLTFAATGIVGSLSATFAVFAPPELVEKVGTVISAPMASMTSSVPQMTSTQPVIKFTKS